MVRKRSQSSNTASCRCSFEVAGLVESRVSIKFDAVGAVGAVGAAQRNDPHVECSHSKTARDYADKISEIKCNTDLPSRPSRPGQQDGLQVILACESCISSQTDVRPRFFCI